MISSGGTTTLGLYDFVVGIEQSGQVDYWVERAGGYPINKRVMLANGDIVKNTSPNNTNDPNSDMTGWVKENSASQIFDESGKNQQQINSEQVSKDNQAFQTWFSKAGGWTINDTVRLTNGDIVINTVAGNTANPNTNRTGWVSFGNSNIVFLGDVLYPEYSPFSNMTINGIPINRKYRMRNYVAERPSGFTWNAHGFKFWLDSDGILRSNIKPDDYDVASKAVDKVEYFIRKGGSTLPANTGTDPNSPQGSLTQILTNINSGNIQNAVIWIKPDVFTDGTVWGVGGAVRINKNISIKPWNTSVTAPYLDTTDNPIVITTESTGLTWTLVSTGVYSTTRAATNVVVDENVLNDLYDWSMYTKVDSLALCTSTAGSWFQDGTTLYVHTLDNRTPDAKLHVYVQKDSAYFLGGNYTAYLERVWLYGGTTPCYGTTALTNTIETIFFNRCKFKYSTNNGMSFYGMKYSIAYECESSYNGSDGYNYHADTTLAKKTQNVEFKCVAYRNGHAWSPVHGVNNGSTTHDGCDIVRAGTVVFENQGPNIADVNGGNSWLFDCVARNSLNPLGGAVNCDFYASQNKMWLDHCDSSGSLYSAAAVGSGVKMYVRNCNLYARLSQATNFQWWSTARFVY